CFHKDGREVWLSWLGNWSEQAGRFFFIGRDMTEARLAQESLLESERLSRNIIETSLDAFVQIDERGSVLNWNTQAEKIVGWPRAEMLGRNAFELIVADSEREMLEQALHRFVTSGYSQVLGRRRDIVARRRDGRDFKAELSITAMRRREGT